MTNELVDTEATDKQDLLFSLKRTLVPILVGIIMASFLGRYIEDSSQLNELLSGLIAAVYYTVIRLLETYWPKASILLGAKGQPVYKKM